MSQEKKLPLGSIDIDINLRTIIKITINQRMPEQVYQTIKEYLKHEFEISDQKINRSTLYENENLDIKIQECLTFKCTGRSYLAPATMPFD